MAVVARVGDRTFTWYCDRPRRLSRGDSASLDDSARSRLDRFPIRTIPGQAAAQRQLRRPTMVRWLQANLAVTLLGLFVAVATLVVVLH